MKNPIVQLGLLSLLLVFGLAQSAFAKDFSTSTTAAGGYDVVAYQTQSKPVRGSGDHLVTHQGETYLFASESNKKKFESNPTHYAPAFGGYCAYGVAVGKKFVGDPEIWKIVDNTLYLNLNREIQKTWKKDVPGNIAKADTTWLKIRDKAPAEL